MPDELWLNMTEAQLKAWANVKQGRADEAGRANLTQARQMIQEHEQAGRDRANER